MRHWLLGAIIALVVMGASAVTSYSVLDYFYGEKSLITSTQTVIIENSGQQVTIDNVQYEVENVEFVADTVVLRYWGYTEFDGPALPTGPSASEEAGGTASQISVPTEAYKQAQATGKPVTVSNTTTTETKPIDALPIAASIGIAMGVVVLAVWAGYRQIWGGATSTLLEQGLHDMTVRDVEIVGYLMELKKFTIPELMKLTKASKITVWRTVQKLVERGLVQPTEQTKLAANGLGGRGKPSRIYKYVGTKSEKR